MADRDKGGAVHRKGVSSDVVACAWTAKRWRQSNSLSLSNQVLPISGAGFRRRLTSPSEALAYTILTIETWALTALRVQSSASGSALRSGNRKALHVSDNLMLGAQEKQPREAQALHTQLAGHE